MTDPVVDRERQLDQHRESPSRPTSVSVAMAEALERLRKSVESSGWEEEDARARAELADIECCRRDLRLTRARAALDGNMRRAIVGDTLDMSQTKAALAVARWRDSGAGWPVLVLQGGTGVGKSVAAAWWIANREGGGHVRSATAVATAWDSSTVRAQDTRETLCECWALVVDDVGTELRRHIEPMGAALRELLECRQGMRTIITTNLTRDGWRKRYPDPRLASRMTRAAWVACGGPDLRSET